MKSCFLLVSIVFTACMVCAATPPTEIRNWKSSAGTSLNAKATGIQDGMVIFEATGGRIVKVPLDKLVEEDRKTIQDHFGTTAEVATAAPVELKHPLGSTSGPIQAGGSKYFVYLPKSLKAGRTYPMIFYTSSGGGDAGTLDQMKEGAEICGWIVACSVESRNEGDGRNCEHSKECVEQLKSSLPIDPKRIYYSGNSGGARTAFTNAAQLGSAGVLAQIAGAQAGELKKGTHYFFISGSYDFNRYDTSYSFAEVKRTSAMRFHPGGHGNGPSWMMTEGMVWLEAQWEHKVKDEGPERVEFETKAFAWLENLKTSESARAAWWSKFFTEMGVLPANRAKLEAYQTELATKPENISYIKGIADLEIFATDVFAKEPRTSAQELTTPAIQKRAEKLLEQYTTTPWIKDVIADFKKTTDKA